MIAKNDLSLPLKLLRLSYDALLGARGPDDLRDVYPLVLDILEMAIAEIDRRIDDDSGDESTVRGE
jgi:hypothetical protein